MKKLFLAILLFVAFNATAQTKYEYAVITHIPAFRELTIAVNGVDYKIIPTAKDPQKGNTNVNPALLEINKMSEDGWELFDTGVAMSTSFVYTFALRRKKA
jgi:hypothetical protein